MSLPQTPEPNAPTGENSRQSGSLAGRLRLLLVSALCIGIVSVAAVSVLTTYQSLVERTERAIPAALAAVEDRWRETLRPGVLTDASRAAVFSGPVGPAPEEAQMAGLHWLEGAETPIWVVTAPTATQPDALVMAPISRSWMDELLRSELLPEGATLATHPKRRPNAGIESPAGGWPETPMIYRNPSRSLVFGGSRVSSDLDLRFVLEIPFESVFAPVVDSLLRTLALGVVLAIVLAGLSRRLGEGLMVGPIHALSEAAKRVTEGKLDEPVTPIPAEAELALLTRTFNEMMSELSRQQSDLQSANERLTNQNEDLQIANEVLGQLSITDGLTKLHNHRFFQDFLTREIKRVARTREHLSILVIDIDDFKRLNDQLGHAAGDELLVRLAEILNDAVREVDLVARYGGEEFVVLAPNTDEVGAFQLGEKVRGAVAEASFIIDDTMRLVKMTVSVGVNTYRGSRKAFFTGADEALYQAKADGKNCVVAAEAPLDDLD